MLFLLCGPPFSGKTTLARMLARRGAVRISLDDVLVERGLRPNEGLGRKQWESASAEACARIPAAAAEGRDVVLDDTLCLRLFRDRYRELAARHQIPVKLIVLKLSAEDVRRRAAENDRAPARPGILPEVLEPHLAAFEWPGADEPHIELDGLDTADAHLRLLGMETMPKYSRLEYERRFLVSPESTDFLGEEKYSRLIEDKYLACGLLRLRKLTDSDTGRVIFKLTKKYPAALGRPQPIVSTFLSEAEYLALLELEGSELRKRRYFDVFDRHTFSISVFEGRLSGLVLGEVETDSEEALRDVRLPPYAGPEVTDDPAFTGGALSRALESELAGSIARARGAADRRS